MTWMLFAVVCELEVDFDPEVPIPTPAPVPKPSPDPVTTPPVTTPATEEPPRIVTGTGCTSNPAGATPLTLVFTPKAFDGPMTTPSQSFASADVRRVAFVGGGTTFDIRTGDVEEVAVTRASGKDADIFLALDDGLLAIQALCPYALCDDTRVDVVLPAPVAQIVGQTVGGDVTVEHAAVWDVSVATYAGDVTVRGDTVGVRAAAPMGRVVVDAPAADIVDVSALEGTIAVTGAATTELCAESALGDVHATLTAADAVYVRPGAGTSVVDVATRPSLVDLRALGGDVIFRLPGGPYDIDLTLIHGYDLQLDGITHDPDATSRIRGFDLDGAVTIEAR